MNPYDPPDPRCTHSAYEAGMATGATFLKLLTTPLAERLCVLDDGTVVAAQPDGTPAFDENGMHITPIELANSLKNDRDFAVCWQRRTR